MKRVAIPLVCRVGTLSIGVLMQLIVGDSARAEPGPAKQEAPARTHYWSEGHGMRADSPPREQQPPVLVIWGHSAAVAVPREPQPSALAAYSILRRKWSLYEAPKGVVVKPISAGHVFGLTMTGDRIPELAAFSPKTARWHRQKLDKPAAGTVHVAIEDWVIGVNVNGRAYAFSGHTGTWDATDIDSPVAVEKDKAIARGQGKTAVFSAETGKWTTQEVK